MVLKGDEILKFMICPLDPNDLKKGSLVEEEARSHYKTETIELDIPLAGKLKPQIIDIPGKKDFFMVYDWQSIEAVKCHSKNDFGQARRPMTDNFSIEH